ncbi:mitochondrial sorting and assembly machinery 50 kDa subunit [Pelomyxa schiedti]|nr:mitochondrial sorting and assembly machinery 50 kDa subunit [Pelomyxa schiedti]
MSDTMRDDILQRWLDQWLITDPNTEICGSCGYPSVSPPPSPSSAAKTKTKSKRSAGRAHNYRTSEEDAHKEPEEEQTVRVVGVRGVGNARTRADVFERIVGHCFDDVCGYPTAAAAGGAAARTTYGSGSRAWRWLGKWVDASEKVALRKGGFRGDSEKVVTMDQLKKVVSLSYERLSALGIFKGVSISLGMPSDSESDRVEVLVDVIEKGSLSLQIGTGLTQSDQSGSLLDFGRGSSLIKSELLYRNAFGRGEELSCGACFGGSTDVSLLGDIFASLKKPFLHNPNAHAAIVATRSNTNNSATTGTALQTNGVAMSIANDTHLLQYELSHRYLMPMTTTPPLPYSTRLLCGHTLKSCVRHVCRLFDTRDNKTSPTSGIGAMSNVEFSGGILGGSVNCIRCSGAAQFALPLVRMPRSAPTQPSEPHLSPEPAPKKPVLLGLVLGMRSGFLLHKGHAAPMEKFFINGGGDVRGFDILNPITTTAPVVPIPTAPHLPQDTAGGSTAPGLLSLGGDAFGSLVAALRLHIPHLEPLCTHVFFNTGNLINLHHPTPLHHPLHPTSSSASSSSSSSPLSSMPTTALSTITSSPHHAATGLNDNRNSVASAVKDLVHNTCSSVGIGLLWPMSEGALELNLCKTLGGPMSHQYRSTTSKLQLCFSMNLL